MKIWLIVLIIIGALIAIGAITYPLTKTLKEKNECTTEDLSFCDISCNVSDDCSLVHNNTCINKDEIVIRIPGKAQLISGKAASEAGVDTLYISNLTICECVQNKCEYNETRF